MGSDAFVGPFIAPKTRDLQKRSAPAPKRLPERRGALAHALTQECGQRRPFTPSPRRRPTSSAWRLPPPNPRPGNTARRAN